MKKILFVPLVLWAVILLGAAEPVGHSVGTQGVEKAESALESLKQGNDRFVNARMKHGQQTIERRVELASGQKPEAIVLSCSDSRVPPEILFDRGLGELFIVRVAGNILDPATVASIEYAVEHLNVPLLIVLGHESCGAVKTALEVKGAESKEAKKEAHGHGGGLTADLDFLVKTIQEPLRDVSPDVIKADPTLVKPVMMNVNFVAEHLPLRSTVIKHKVEKKELLIVRGIYGLKTGRVEFWRK